MEAWKGHTPTTTQDLETRGLSPLKILKAVCGDKSHARFGPGPEAMPTVDELQFYRYET